MLRTVLDSLKRQYEKGYLNKSQIDELLADGKITQVEYDYITGKYQ